MGQFDGKKILGGGILAINLSTGKILLCRRGMKGAHPNTFASFGGTFEEKDIIPQTTAIREFIEETGCKVPFRISKLPFYVNKNNFLTFYTYLGLFDTEFPVNINEESLGYGWYDLNNLPDNLLPEVGEMFENRFKDLSLLLEKLDVLR